MSGSATITIRETEWQVSLATTYLELMKGLGGLPSIDPETGMLFVLPQEMSVDVTTAPMLFNLDIIFIDSDFKVVDVARNVPPGMTVSEATPVRYFLEVNAGEAEEVEEGDIVEITISPTELPPLDGGILPQAMIILVELLIVGVMLGGIGRLVSRAIAPPKRKELPKEETLTQKAKVVTVPGGSRWICRKCGRELKAGEQAVKIGASVYCSECVKKAKPQSEGITGEEWIRAEVMWEATQELKEKGDPFGTTIWYMINRYYPGNKERQLRLLGFLEDFLTEQKKRHPEGVPTNVAMDLAKKWEVEKAFVTEAMRFFPGQTEPPEISPQYYTDTEDTINKSGLMFQTELDDAFAKAIARARKIAGAAKSIEELREALRR